MTSSKKLVCRHQQHLILAVKHGGGVMIWDFFYSNGTWAPCTHSVHHELIQM